MQNENKTENENLINELSEIAKEKEPFKSERFLKILEERPEIKAVFKMLSEELEKQ